MTKSLIARLEHLTPVGLTMLSCAKVECAKTGTERADCVYIIRYTPNSSYPSYAFGDHKRHTYDICLLEAKKMYGSERK